MRTRSGRVRFVWFLLGMLVVAAMMPARLVRGSRWYSFLPSIVGVGRSQTNDDFHVVLRRGKAWIYDGNGKLVGREVWPRVLYSDEVLMKQSEYNQWVRTKVRTSTVHLLEVVRTVPQHPLDFVHIFGSVREPGGERRRFHGSIPAWIEPTGVLDRDTLAIPMYKAMFSLLELTVHLGGLSEALLYNGYPPSIADLTPRGYRPPGLPDPPDPITWLALWWEVQHGFSAVNDLHSFLLGVRMATSQGNTFSAEDEVSEFEMRLDWIEKHTHAVTRNGNSVVIDRFLTEIADADGFPDFLTEHVEYQQLTPEFVDSLKARELAVKAHLMMAQQIAALLEPRKP